MVNWMKKITGLWTICLVLMLSVGMGHAERPHVIDDAGLFTTEQREELITEIESLNQKYPHEIVLVTIDDAMGKSAGQYADDTFDYNGYGFGEERSGVLLLIDMDNREVYVSTSGETMKYFTDERQSQLLDAVVEHLAEGDYYAAAKTYLRITNDYFTAGIVEGQYFEEGETPYEIKQVSAVDGIIGAVGALLSGLGVYGGVQKNYTGKPKPQVFDFRKNSMVQFANTQDVMTNTFVTTRRIPKSNNTGGGGGSGKTTTYTSSSGRTHSGMGKKF